MAVRDYIVITGCDSGMGEAFCGKFLEEGFPVIAGYLNPPEVVSELHFPLKIDQRSDESVSSFGEYVRKIIGKGKIDTLIVNGGIVKFGPVQDLPLSHYRETMEVNLFGTIRIVRELIDLCIAGRSGIIIHSSLAGRIALPFFSPYTSSKFALEGFGESLRRELGPLGVQVCLLDSGGVATPIWNKGREEDLSFVSDLYKPILLNAADIMISGGNQGLPVHVAADRIFRLSRGKMPPNYILSKGISSNILAHLPKWLLDFLIRLQFGIRYGRR